MTARPRASLSRGVPRLRNIRLAIGIGLMTPVTTVAQLQIAAVPSDAEIEPAPSSALASSLITNERFIEDLERPLDLTDDLAVLRFVLDRLTDEVKVYPTENYFYFRFYVHGREIWGTIGLLAHDRDEGVLSFGYSEPYDPDLPDGPDRIGGGGSYSARDGVEVVRLDPLVYRVTVADRSVVFRLNPTPLRPPGRARLAETEVFVGPVHDESGLRFHLLFERAESHLFMVLNDDDPVSEVLTARDDRLVVGRRTGFAFYPDREHDRLILIGVRGESALRNDWNDGPHDQMPDNAIARGLIPDYQDYLEASYPHVRGRIDRYGNLLDTPGSRIAVAPYLVYFDERELHDRVETCQTEATTGSGLRACLTEHRFVIPADQRRSLPEAATP